MINTERFSKGLRKRGIDRENKRILITDFHGSEQEQDLTEPANCDGVGRIRHFKRHQKNPSWPPNPLPIDPATKVMHLPRTDTLRTQAFQNAICNWRCWYCFVDFDLLSGNLAKAQWLTADDLLARYFAQPDPPVMIDLTGGQPDLVPEWIPWMIQAAIASGKSERVYLWSDDNLSNDYFWQFLTDTERELIATYPRYGRVCCFKGFNSTSFGFNTDADPVLFDRQFDLFRRLRSTGMDLYAYTTFTTPEPKGITDDMKRFVDRLQEISPSLPLRTVPLEIALFTPVRGRLRDDHREAIRLQYDAIDAWKKELDTRFTSLERAQPITEVPR
jgi:uncharacterized Fe-S cluster-containing radical SAM superfamily protein